MEVLAQIVDTLKLHYYFTPNLTAKSHFKYALFVENLKKQKDEAMDIHHSNNDMRFVNTKLGIDEFRVMATTRSGFQVTIKNQDIEISFKAPKFAPATKPNKETEGNKKVDHTHNPIAKIEFRASYLARVGHVKAVEYVNEMFEKWVLNDFSIKVSEIHVATDIQGYNFSEIDYYRFQTRKITNAKHTENIEDSSTHFGGRTCTGFSFGKGDEMLRIYDKTVEIQKNPDKAFIRSLIWESNPNYDRDKKVWRIGAQYRREKLKTIYTKGQFLDGFFNVLDAIPELWGKALETVVFKDLDYSHCFEMMTSCKMTFGNETFINYVDLKGVSHSVKASSITKRYQRAPLHELWEFIQTWKGYTPEITEVHKAPKTSAFQWVYNQIKGLFTTLFRHSGELSPSAFVDAFTRSNEMCIKGNNLSLVESGVVNNIKYLDSRRTFIDLNKSLYPSDKVLQENIYDYLHMTISDIETKMKENVYFDYQTMKMKSKNSLSYQSDLFYKYLVKTSRLSA